MIKLNDFSGEPGELKKQVLQALANVIDDGNYILGSEVATFERNWSKVCGVSYGVGVANGMDAIEIALRSLGVGKCDEVITTAMTAFATTLAIIRCGATPVLADIVADTALLSIEQASKCVTAKTKAIVLVHLYGQVKNMREWQEFAKKHGIFLIEDCAQAHLAKSGDITAGNFGVAGAYSFYPTKNLGTYGDAGMLVTSSEELADIAKKLRNYGQNQRYYHSVIGLNSRMDELHAAILNVRLTYLPRFTNRRKEIAAYYNKKINNQYIKLMAEPNEYESHVYHLYVLRTKLRDKLIDYLKLKKISTLIHYPVAIHNQIASKNLVKIPYSLKETETHASECLTIPCHPQISDIDMEYIVESLNNFEQ
jgi:dTDP-4-amino-4,6-dideoxygalactose transaminase